MYSYMSKSATFQMRVPADELAEWRRQAAFLSMSVAELVRQQMKACRVEVEPVRSGLWQEAPSLVRLPDVPARSADGQRQALTDPPAVRERASYPTGTLPEGAREIGLAQSYAAPAPARTLAAAGPRPALPPRVAQTLARDVEPMFKGRGKR